MPAAPAKPLVYLETSFISYLTAPFSTDALHIALAAVYGADILLTWNCRHIANPVTLPKTVETIVSAGYRCPALATPAQLLEARNDEPTA